jgi:hypothetical protein
MVEVVSKKSHWLDYSCLVFPVQEKDLDQADTMSTRDDVHVLGLLLRSWWSTCPDGDPRRKQCELRDRCEGMLSW